MTEEHIPRENTIVLGPTEGDESVWYLKYRCDQCGEEIRTLLPAEQLEEMDEEFTGVQR